MNCTPDFCRNRATKEEIEAHLVLCDDTFMPPLSKRVQISDYADKISTNALRFEAWTENLLVGLLAVYCNDTSNGFAYITSVSILPEFQGRRIASQLIRQGIDYLRVSGFEVLELEVDRGHGKAVRLYEEHGFIARRTTGRNLVMNLNLGEGV